MTSMTSNPTRAIARSTVPEIADAVHKCISRRGAQRDEREDLEQATWVRLLERLREAPEITSLAAFATGVARNVAREHRRQQIRHHQLEQVYTTDLAELGQASRPTPPDA